MKIVHLCLGSFYPDNYAYQENMLPKYHKELGYEVEVIASTQSFDSNGKPCFTNRFGPYQNEYNIQVTRLPYKSERRLWKKLKRYKRTLEVLEKSEPDILFIHGGQFLDMDKIVSYLKKHPSVKVYVDNHADYSNSATNLLSKIVLHKIIWRHCLRIVEPYTTKFYGVLPARVKFLEDVYGLPSDKCELLVMGADDDLVNSAKTSNQRDRIRTSLSLSKGDFLIVTGGKINKHRPEVLALMKAVIDISRPNVKLIFFGTSDEAYKRELDELSEDEHIINIGWIKSVETYNYIETADLVVFPGLHSVMWEQAVAQGKPCLFRDLEGFHHVDVGGNALFLEDVSSEGLKAILLQVIDDTVLYSKMKSVAEEKGMVIFSYKSIACRCLEEKPILVE